jgi:transcriptional regulator with XRE-family HTH domain
MQSVSSVAQEIRLLYRLRNTPREAAMDSQMLDVGLHERRRAQRMQDPDFRESYDRASREIAQTDAVIRALDSLRAELGVSKAELARRVNRNASSVRRLFTADQTRPELPLIIAIADALDAEVCIVPRQAEDRTRNTGLAADGVSPLQNRLSRLRSVSCPRKTVTGRELTADQDQAAPSRHLGQSSTSKNPKGPCPL